MPASALSPQLSPEKKVVLHLKPIFFLFCPDVIYRPEPMQTQADDTFLQNRAVLAHGCFFSAVANLLSKNVLALLEDQDSKAMRSHD